MRFEVTVTRRFIVYAPSVDDAENKVRTELVRGVPCVTPKALVFSTAVLPDVREEGHGPEIDRAPARETRA